MQKCTGQRARKILAMPLRQQRHALRTKRNKKMPRKMIAHGVARLAPLSRKWPIAPSGNLLLTTSTWPCEWRPDQGA